jgi:L-cystine uptake protein TcyP (sodium:dicarboxylate symporter family)
MDSQTISSIKIFAVVCACYNCIVIIFVIVMIIVALIALRDMDHQRRVLEQTLYHIFARSRSSGGFISNNNI